jgi:hypothetical protein
MFATRLLFPPHLSPDAPAGAPAPPAVPPLTPERRQQSLVDRLMQRHGSTEAALAFLATANITQEDRIETLNAENKAYREKLPEGSTVISAAEAKNLEKLKALGTIDQIVAGFEEGKTLKAEKVERETREGAKTLAKAAGADEEAFAEHYTGRKLKGEVRNVETVEHGQKVTKGLLYVQAGDKEPWVSWSEYLTKLPAHEQRALTPVPTQGQPPRPGQPPVAGVPFPVITPPARPGEAPSGDPVNDYMTKRNAVAAAKPNPILGPRPQAPAKAGAAS